VIQLDITDLNVVERTDFKEIKNIRSFCVIDLSSWNSETFGNPILRMIFINYYVTDVNIVHIIQHIRNEEQIVSEFRIDKFKMECSL